MHTATLVNAQIAGVDQMIGSIEKGKKADMFVVKENPLEDITALRNVSMVVINGQLIENPVVNKYPEVEEVLDSIAI